jgi:hypothetical protein
MPMKISNSTSTNIFSSWSNRNIPRRRLNGRLLATQYVTYSSIKCSEHFGVHFFLIECPVCCIFAFIIEDVIFSSI